VSGGTKKTEIISVRYICERFVEECIRGDILSHLFWASGTVSKRGDMVQFRIFHD